MRVQWKSLFHDSKKMLDDILSILKNKNKIGTKNINIFNREQLDKFNVLNKQQFEMRDKLNIESIQLLTDPIKKEKLKQEIIKLLSDKLTVKQIAKSLKVKRKLVKLMLNESQLKVIRSRSNYKDFDLKTKTKMKCDVQQLINSGFKINEIALKLQTCKKDIEMTLKEFFKWDRLTSKYRTLDDLRCEINNKIIDVQQIDMQVWGSTEFLSNKWNVSHTEVGRFIRRYCHQLLRHSS